MYTFSTTPIAAVVEVGQKSDPRSIGAWKHKRIIDIDDDIADDHLPLPHHD
jgi:hypothetical protein